MTRFAATGLNLNADLTGQGRPLVLLHGFTGNNASWQAQQAVFSPYYQTIALEMPGHGDSDAPSDPACYSMERTTTAIGAGLDDLDISKAAILGYSMGARIALAFAISQPERVSALILESGSPGLPTAEERAARRQADNALADFIEQDGLEKFVEYWENLPLFASQRTLPSALQRTLHLQRLANRPIGLANSLRGVGTGAQPSLWEQLNELKLPTLLIVGKLDPKFCQIARQIQPQIAASHLEIVAGAGHTVHLEQPAEFNRLVLRFLADVGVGN